jgi:uncharacterized membrane protein YbhN (UPF0104 family)
MSQQRRDRWWVALLWIAAPVLLALALRQAPMAQVGEVLSRLDIGQVLALMLVNLGVLLLMAARWGLLLRMFGARVSLPSLLAYRLAGFGMSYVTPGPQFGGEPLQVHLLHRRQGTALETAIASVFLDRLIDLLVNFTFLAVGIQTILMGGVGEGWLWPGIWLLILALLLIPAGHLIALAQGIRPMARLLDIFAGRLGPGGKLVPALYKAAGLAGRAEGQIGTLLRERPAAFSLVLGIALLTWLGMVFEYWLCLYFLGVDARLPEVISALTAARLAFLAPLPAGLGAFEASQALAAQLLGWGSAVGIATSMVIRARDLFFAALGLGLGGWPTFQAWLRTVIQKERV